MLGSDKEDSDDQRNLEGLISSNEAAELSGLSQGHIRHLLRIGEMKGRKLGRDWFTTKQAVREYLTRGEKPGPKPQK